MTFQVSGCGYACAVCKMLEKGECPGCTHSVFEVQNCPIMVCLREKQLDTCLKCLHHNIDCKIYMPALKKCPLRAIVRERRIQREREYADSILPW